ncbi:Coenzyme A biosynthesis bifunctional protein CoaBC [Jeotgalicoccus aerolatus]|uniref:Coenzyme A biosynthesis bifunctional protein CoaBC n=1 Tax=Jeotgalicoccus aerolatus TaxID=709510 RepID=A0A1G8W5R9_9STAP|nr:bifunctional phosphopantothenoylcysteine decarboxylase/phosphopantothenate--cysteine ligase CoaBC [Jeotgalicoccus aerolatus]MBP1951431.1 phosphopantothenoylcysteine decarboxylase/phosphopantothenate--cysteine ligase [Jeotgalicoccus aerolatus]NMA81718.1 bifunctional phosphopantothenoylcysteine decarboxylase/phosphopantothenate--cysteine ligase CoaBC [Jeotgalicoccus aerolatus]CAD2076679.1 Coenzyme A biosynthesis bifunctional protein CoaBC [Jeotgalicoccus aerolatus]SDJ73638.1 phosphopantothenoy
MANIVLGVTGGIASYKAIDLTSKLIQSGHAVRVVLTDNTTEFVTPLAFQAISRNHVYTNTFLEEDPSHIAHINIGEWADIIAVVPVTANTISKFANGIYDNMLLNVLAANTKPVLMAPAMNVHMLRQPSVQENIDKLRSQGVEFIDSETGFLACGYNAKGRLASVPDIMKKINSMLNRKQDLKGKKVLVTAGPTRERLDPIRYLSNFSSGKMGYSIADSFSRRGAEVILVSGPVSIQAPNVSAVIDVESTAEMFEAVKNHLDADIGIFTAAVSDFTVKEKSGQKIKKKAGSPPVIELTETEDILKYAGHHSDGMYVIGFAAETEDVENYALGKLQAKKADVIIMNDVSDTSIGMNSDDNEVTMLFKDGEKIPLAKMPKTALAEEIAAVIAGKVMD